MMKFDQYYLYGMDNIDGKNNSAPHCGPGHVKDACKKTLNSKKSCCAHVVMTDQNSGDQTSFYRCMNEKIVDISFTMEIDGMKTSMMCSESSATKVVGAIMASLAALISIAIF